jgi:hypothetical protein
MYTCSLLKCRLTLRFGEPAVCPMRGHQLLPYEPKGIVIDFHNGCAAKREFKDATLRLERFMPATQRGLFDLSLNGGGSQIVVTVRVHPTFTMPPKRDWGRLNKDYAELKPWAEPEKFIWMGEQQRSIDDIWNASPFKLRLSQPGGWRRDYKPEMRIVFTNTKSDAHIVASVEKSPPIDPNMFNCGGSRLDLAQIITGNPKAVSTAALTSQSGVPVAMSSALLGHQIKDAVIRYNIVAHEYGHMLGLPDEYNAGGEVKGKDIKADAYAIHCKATDKLCKSASVVWHWNEYSDSLMSTGNRLYARHLITVWEAVTVATQRCTVPALWSIV